MTQHELFELIVAASVAGLSITISIFITYSFIQFLVNIVKKLINIV